MLMKHNVAEYKENQENERKIKLDEKNKKTRMFSPNKKR